MELGMHAVGLGAGQAIKAEEAGALAPGLPASITSNKQSAADFDAEQAPVSSFILNGVDYSHHRSMKVRLSTVLLLPGKCAALTRPLIMLEWFQRALRLRMGNSSFELETTSLTRIPT